MMSLPLTIPCLNEDQHQAIIELLKEENQDLNMLQDLLELIGRNNVRMIKKYI